MAPTLSASYSRETEFIYGWRQHARALNGLRRLTKNQCLVACELDLANIDGRQFVRLFEFHLIVELAL